MTAGYAELTLGGVLVAPFVPYALGAACLYLMLRPLLRRVATHRFFVNPSLVGICLYILLLATLMIGF